MRTFKDEKGRPWEISINVGTVKAVKTEAGVDLLDIDDGSTFSKLADDPIRLGDVLWVLVRKQCEAAGVSDEEFGAALAGDSLEDAVNALMEEVVDFFRRPQRELLRKMLAKGRQVQEKQQAEATRKMEEFLETWDPSVETASGGSSTSAPASLG